MVLVQRSGLLYAFVREMRLHHWIKNLLVLVPAVMSHTILQADVAGRVFLGFLAFSFAASAGYVVNDLLDIDADRSHRQKRNRPLAAGTLPLSAGLVLAPVLLIFALLVGWFASPVFLVILALYGAVTVAYSLALKRFPIVDVFVLAGLYTLRILAGGAAANVVISPWLASFSVFFFLSLALLKRYAELRALHEGGESNVRGRGYVTRDVEVLRSFGSASAYVSVLVLALYINSDQVIQLYARPWILWFLTVLFLFWVTRFWFLADRGKVVDDPIVFAARDAVSWVIGVLMVSCIALLAAL